MNRNLEDIQQAASISVVAASQLSSADELLLVTMEQMKKYLPTKVVQEPPCATHNAQHS